MCTAVCFPDDAGNLYLGRNLDWTCGYGERCRIVPAGYRLAYTHLPAVPARDTPSSACASTSGASRSSSTAETTRASPSRGSTSPGAHATPRTRRTGSRT